MKKQFVQSNFKRRENDNYPTIDTRCVDGFLKCHGTGNGAVVDVCAKEGSAIVDYLKSLGYIAYGAKDAFDDSVNGDIAEWIITNPPYKRGLVDEIVRHQIWRVQKNIVSGLAILVRANFSFAKTRKDMFAAPEYWGEIKLCFRPWWTEEREQEPIHSYVWHVWQDHSVDFPTVKYYYAPHDTRYVVKKK
jgi:hypothetical protein